jgi:leishmanolysin
LHRGGFVFAAVGLTVALLARQGSAHECMHDDVALMNEQVRLLAQSPVQQSYAHVPNMNAGQPRFDPANALPIRIVVNAEGLQREGAYCGASEDQVPSYRTPGEKVTCASFHVLSPEIRNTITQTVLPAAIARIQQLVSVERIQGNLLVPSASTCGDTPIPASHVASGVPNADLVVYVTAVPNPNFVSMWSGACVRDQNLRAVVGRMNFDPSVAANTANIPQLIEDAVHELLHILGVSSVEMFRADHKTIVSKRGKDRAMVVTPRVVNFVRTYTGCPSLEGAEVEDEGASLSRGSHWERKVWFEEAMTTVGGTKVSGLSLSFLADINVGYTINLNAADGSMIYGKGDGCGIHNNKCNTVEGGKDRYYCFEEQNSGGSFNLCSWDHKSVGFCAIDNWETDFPPLYQYFSNPKRGGSKYMDGCPSVIAYENRQCSIPAVETADDLKWPYMFETNSRCFDGVNVIKQGENIANDASPRCLEARCTEGGAVQFKAPDAATWVTCGAKGTTVTMNGGYTGQVVCPSAFDVCRSLGSATAPTASPTTAAPTSAPTTTSAPATTTTSAPPATTSAPPATTTPTTSAPPASSPAPTTAIPPSSNPSTHHACLTHNGFFYELTSDASITTLDRYQSSVLVDRQHYSAFHVPAPGTTTWDEGVGFAATMQTRNAWLNAESTAAASWVQDSAGADTWTWSTTVNGAPTQFVFTAAKCSGGAPPAPTPAPPVAPTTSAPNPSLHRACVAHNGFFYELTSDASITTLDRYQSSVLVDRQHYSAFHVPAPGTTTWDEGVGFAATMQTRNAWLNAESTAAASWVQDSAGADTWTWSTTVNGAPTQFVFTKSNCA